MYYEKFWNNIFSCFLFNDFTRQIFKSCMVCNFTLSRSKNENSIIWSKKFFNDWNSILCNYCKEKCNIMKSNFIFTCKYFDIKCHAYFKIFHKIKPRKGHTMKYRCYFVWKIVKLFTALHIWVTRICTMKLCVHL